jgi:hypothetical protein
MDGEEFDDEYVPYAHVDEGSRQSRKKVIRQLDFFTFFDPLRHNAFVSLELAESSGMGRRLLGAGMVTRYFEYDDEVQEDDSTDEFPPQSVLLEVLYCRTDYTVENA